MQDSLSAKISETIAKEEKGDQETSQSMSNSPCSTVSSSGEVEGEYVVNPEQEEEEEEEVDYEEDIGK